MIMSNKKTSVANTIRYLRIPHWVRSEYRCFKPRDPFFDVHLRAKEHRAKNSSLSIRGILFETEMALSSLTCVAMRVSLSEDTVPFEFDCRIIRSQQIGDDHRYRIKAGFIARTREEINRIALFVKRYY